MANEQDDLIRKLDALLDVERDALISGQLEMLAEIVEEKEALIDALNAVEVENSESLAPVNTKVQRNQALLENALDGIRAVSKRLAELREVRRAFDTYDRRGQKSQIRTNPLQSVEKRA